jgi:hypothetical protein
MLFSVNSYSQHIKYGYTYEGLRKNDTIVTNMFRRNLHGKFEDSKRIPVFIDYLSYLSEEGFKYKIFIHYFGGTTEFCAKYSEYLKKDLYNDYLKDKVGIFPDDIIAMGNTRPLICKRGEKRSYMVDNDRIEIVITEDGKSD